MKATIQITGQLRGNFTLRNLLDNGNCVDGRFGGYRISFNTIKEAKEAIRYANRMLRADSDSRHCTRMSKDASSIGYDASSASINVG